MKKEELKKDVVSFLQGHPLMVLATASAEGVPRANTVIFYVDDRLNFYFITREGSQKVRNMDENDKVALSVSFDPPYNVEAVGAAERVTDKKTRELVMDKFVEHAVGLPDIWPPVFRYSDADYVVFRIRPKSVRVLDLTSQHIYQSEPPFTDLL
ncbi:MAG: pyridoxamine 5'-phosphate oxidase family protein [bacterium]